MPDLDHPFVPSSQDEAPRDVLDRDAAEAVLRERYGEPTKETNKLVAFALADTRDIALQRDVQGVQLWLEGAAGTDCPAQDRESYTAERGRHANLPGRLNHQPSSTLRRQGFPRPVTLVRVHHRRGLIALLDWYDAPHQSLDRAALEAMKRAFLAEFPDFPDCGFMASAGQYFEVERSYKQVLLDRVQDVLGATSALTDAQCGGEILDTLAAPPSNLLGWRTAQHLKAVRNSHPKVLETAAGILVRAPGDQAAAVERFVTSVWPIYAAGQERSLPYSDLRTIPTMVLALAKPAEAMAVRTQPIQAAGLRLLGRNLFGPSPLTAQEYRDVLAMARAVAAVMSEEWGWTPRDLWDVQGFLWVAYTSETMTKGTADMTAAPIADQAPEPAPTNLILYGPPGTGKTYKTAEEAVMLCDGVLPEGGRPALMARYEALRRSGRIAFVTFHQSYSYEDFVEGLRPETAPDEEGEGSSASGFRLKPVPGVFQRLAARATQAGAVRAAGPAQSAFDLAGRNVFKMSLGRSADQSDVYEDCLRGGYVALGWGGTIDWSDPVYASYDAILTKWRTIEPGISGHRGDVVQTWRLRATMKPGDLVVVPQGNSAFRAIGEVTGAYTYAADAPDFRHRRAVRWLRVFDRPMPVGTILEGAFTAASLYLINASKLRKDALADLLAPDTMDAGEPQRREQFVLIIDEVNRANVSKVFGELITLLESDKRLGAANALTVTLPYSGETFGVPSNLHLIGTMNTADRSIALLDTALRRRFAFRELTPRPDLVPPDIEGIDLPAVLTTLNTRIEYLVDREHRIGHAFFMGCRTRQDLDAVMRDRVIPLLAEYFFEDWERIRLVLGEETNEGAFLSRTRLPPPRGLDETGPERWRYTVRTVFADNAYEQLTA